MSLFLIKSLSANRPCRVRLYEDDNKAYLDFKRPTSEAPTGQHGVIFDVNLEEALYWRLNPLAFTTKDPSQCKLVIEPPASVQLETEKVL